MIFAAIHIAFSVEAALSLLRDAVQRKHIERKLNSFLQVESDSFEHWKQIKYIVNKFNLNLFKQTMYIFMIN